ncbi:unnamed protein product [Commensalibacter communis]|uniref:Uncharacterized protein n=1 Tax=Commensalibacter communis TaxID=2972786 RepID=A0A9W4TQX2_9PROT|nr:hypothetical protein [Commensalibacter communis]CAI3953798.1 unnamed protein product [Commensalibacter communis]CAI3956392.1 unnamed protein product [Commensalibacter communis]CAI3956792.1 unnamed protein product [Commensalibacter communis]CAI3956873.1 unnamed protein product [Commensalibacter communis]
MTKLAIKYDFVKPEPLQIKRYFKENDCEIELGTFLLVLVRIMFHTKDGSPFGKLSFENDFQRNKAIRAQTGLRKALIQHNIDLLLEKKMLHQLDDGALTAPFFFETVNDPCHLAVAIARNEGEICHA